MKEIITDCIDMMGTITMLHILIVREFSIKNIILAFFIWWFGRRIINCIKMLWKKKGIIDELYSLFRKVQKSGNSDKVDFICMKDYVCIMFNEEKQVAYKFNFGEVADMEKVYECKNRLISLASKEGLNEGEI